MKNEMEEFFQALDKKKTDFSFSLIMGITPKICMVCFILINKCSFEPFYVFGSCFRMLAVVLVSDFLKKNFLWKILVL